MKKLLMVTMLSLAFGSFAGEAQKQETTVVTSSGATSQSQGGAQSQQQGIQQAGNSTISVGCMVNCSDQSSAAREAGAADIQIALINAATAQRIAENGTVIKNTPSVNGPALVSSNDTCMGSTSGSVNIAGLGLGGGTSWVDTNCKILKNARELWNMGMKSAAMALMCSDSANREALELTGFECPQTTRARKNAQASVPATSANTQSTVYTDPYIRARMGLK